MSNVPTVREVSLGDHREEVIALWRRNLPGAARGDARTKLQVGYLDNPAGAGRGLLLHAGAEPAAVGAICLHPRRLHLGERVVEADNLADLAVDAGYRTLGPALMLLKGAVGLASDSGGLLYALPNRNSAAVCKRAGLGAIGELRRYARVVSGRHPLVARWSKSLAPLAAPFVTAALTALDTLRALTLRPRLRCRPAAFDDPAIDDLWARRPRHLLLGERSATMLRWRYCRTQAEQWRLWLARDADDAAVGFLVWRLRDGMAEVGDFFAADPARQTAALLNRFARHARGAGARSVSLEFFGSSEVVRQLERAGYRARGEATPMVVGILPDGLPEAGDAQRWYLTAFDNDAD